jgi:hypothetical protein
MNLIALGTAACSIADAFAQYPQYEIYKIDVDISGKRCYSIPEFKDVEEYENYSYPKLKSFFKGLEGETTFIITGSGNSSCASLKIIEHIKKLPISVLYVKPDVSLLSEKRKMIEKVVYNVLQEYTRSAVFEKMCIISNASVDSVIGGAPIMGYYDYLNETIVPALHMVNYFSNNKAILGEVSQPKETHRLYTVGLLNTEKNEEKMFFSLDNSRHKCYIYGVNEEKLKTDKNLMQKIKKQIDSKKEEHLNISYAVYSTDYDYDIGYVIERTPYIQK